MSSPQAAAAASPSAAAPRPGWNRATKVPESHALDRRAHGCPLPPDYALRTQHGQPRSASAERPAFHAAGGRSASAPFSRDVDGATPPKSARHHRDRVSAAAAASFTAAGGRSGSAFSNVSSARTVSPPPFVSPPQRNNSHSKTATSDGRPPRSAAGGSSVERRLVPVKGAAAAASSPLSAVAAAGHRSSSVGSAVSDGGVSAVSAAELAWEKEKQRMLKLSSEQLVRKSLQMHFDILRLRRKRASDAAHVYRLRKCREFVSACADCVQDATLRLALLAAPDTTLFDDDAGSLSPLAKVLHSHHVQDASPIVGAAAAAVAKRQGEVGGGADGGSQRRRDADSSFFRSADPEEDAGPHAEPDLSRNLSLLLDALACAETSMQQLQDAGERERHRADGLQRQVAMLDEAVRSLQAGRVELLNLHAAQTEQYELKLSDMRIRLEDMHAQHLERTAQLREEHGAQQFRIADLERLAESLQMALQAAEQGGAQAAAERDAAAHAHAAEMRMLREAMEAQGRELQHSRESAAQMQRSGAEAVAALAARLEEEREAAARRAVEVEQRDEMAALQGDCAAGFFRHVEARQQQRLGNTRSAAVATEESEASEIRRIVEQSQQVIDAVHEQIFGLEAEMAARAAQHAAERRRAEFAYRRSMLFALERADRVRVENLCKESSARVLQNVLFAPADLPVEIFAAGGGDYEEQSSYFVAGEEEIFSFDEFNLSSSPASAAAAEASTNKKKRSWSQRQLAEEEAQQQQQQQQVQEPDHAVSSSGAECLVFACGDEEVLVNENWHAILSEAWSRQPPPVERRKKVPAWKAKELADAAEAAAAAADESAEHGATESAVADAAGGSAEPVAESNPPAAASATVDTDSQPTSAPATARAVEPSFQLQQLAQSEDGHDVKRHDGQANEVRNDSAFSLDTADDLDAPPLANTAPPSAYPSPSHSSTDVIATLAAEDVKTAVAEQQQSQQSQQQQQQQQLDQAPQDSAVPANHSGTQTPVRTSLDELADGAIVSDEMLTTGRISPARRSPTPSQQQQQQTEQVGAPVAAPTTSGRQQEQPAAAAAAAADARVDDEAANLLRQQLKKQEGQTRMLHGRLVRALASGLVGEKEAKERQNLYLTEYYGILSLLRQSMTMTHQLALANKKRVEAQKAKRLQQQQQQDGQEQQQQTAGAAAAAESSFASSAAAEDQPSAAPAAEAAAPVTSPRKRSVTFEGDVLPPAALQAQPAMAASEGEKQVSPVAEQPTIAALNTAQEKSDVEVQQKPVAAIAVAAAPAAQPAEPAVEAVQQQHQPLPPPRLDSPRRTSSADPADATRDVPAEHTAAPSTPPRPRSLLIPLGAAAAAAGLSPTRTSPISRSPRASPTRFNDAILEMLENARKAFQSADEEARALLSYLEPTPVKSLPQPKRTN